MGRETMTDIKPVAWMTKEGAIFRQCDITDLGYAPKHWTPLYTADALRAAQVQVLREAADWLYSHCTDHPWAELRRMVDELERSGK